MGVSGWTNRGEKLALDSHFREQSIPLSFKIVLVTDAIVPSADTNVLSDLTEIAAGNGYTSGGYALSRNETDFDWVSEDDASDQARMQVKNVVFSASGGSIPASGDGASYAILADDGDNVWHYWWLNGEVTVTDGNDLLLEDLEMRGLAVGGANSFTNRGIYGLLRDVFQNEGDITSFALVLATAAIPPTPDSNVLADVSEIPGGNGYVSSGYLLSRDSADFPTLIENDSDDNATLSIKAVNWTASGGSIPATGEGIVYVVLLDNLGNIAIYWTLSAERAVSDGQTFSLWLTLGLGATSEQEPITYLLDEFITEQANPLSAPREAEGSGEWEVVTDTEGNLSITADGELAIAGGKASPAYGDPGMWSEAVTRAPGVAMIWKHAETNLTKYIYVGFTSAQSGAAIIECFWLATGTLNAKTTGITPADVGNFGTEQNYYAIILMSAGAYFLRRSLGGEWEMVWVDESNSTNTLYASIVNYNSIANFDRVWMGQLPAPWNVDNGIYTLLKSGSFSSYSFDHPSNFILNITISAVPSSGAAEIYIRKQDSSNLWDVEINSSGDLKLWEKVGGGWSERASESAAVAGGNVISIIANGTTIKVYANGDLKLEYSSASNFSTETDGNTYVGTGQTWSDMTIYQITPTGTAQAALDAAAGI